MFYGAGLANVIRGVPLGHDRYFFPPLWTNWRAGADPGILDWYSLIGGLLALISLALQGALYITIKTQGDLQARARQFAVRLRFSFLLYVFSFSRRGVKLIEPFHFMHLSGLYVGRRCGWALSGNAALQCEPCSGHHDFKRGIGTARSVSWSCVVSLGIVVKIGYFVLVHWMFRGKVNVENSGYGH
jgi:cytochrome d ubiquinol oxidase subunit II